MTITIEQKNKQLFNCRVKRKCLTKLIFLTYSASRAIYTRIREYKQKNVQKL